MKSILKATALVAAGAIGMLATLYAIVNIQESGYISNRELKRFDYET